MRGGDVHQPLRFPGQSAEQFDTGANGITERNYNNARWYRPSWGRYTQADALSLERGVNQYAYAADNPLVFTDPFGLATCTYYISRHFLTCRSNNNPGLVRNIGPADVFSGENIKDVPCKNNLECYKNLSCRNNPECANVKDVGPIPPGSYKINNTNSRPHFFDLEPIPPVRLWETWILRKRSGFELHPGSVSVGCITINSSHGIPSSYSDLERLLKKEDPHNTLQVQP